MYASSTTLAVLITQTQPARHAGVCMFLFTREDWTMLLWPAISCIHTCILTTGLRCCYTIDDSSLEAAEPRFLMPGIYANESRVRKTRQPLTMFA